MIAAMKHATAVLLAAISISAHASDWVNVGGQVSVDVSSIQSDGDIAQAWSRVALSPPRNGIARMVTLRAFSCSAHSDHLMRAVHYSAGGDVLYDETFTGSKFDDVVPDTPLDSIATFVCSRK